MTESELIALRAMLVVHQHTLQCLLAHNPAALRQLRLERGLIENELLYSDQGDAMQAALSTAWDQLLAGSPPEPG